MVQAIHQVIRAEIRSIREVKGGDIGLSLSVETESDRYFVKYRHDLPAQTFLCEAEGLAVLRQAGGLPVPQTFYAGNIPGLTGGMIVLQWIDRGRPRADTDERLGRGLAFLHQTASVTGKFGFHQDNYLGELPQANRWRDSWREFYRDQRLKPLLELADERGLLHPARRKRLLRLMDELGRFLPERCRPSLLHGDLWSGNWIADTDGQPYLIDPAVFYGDREYEMAFTELFGGFSPKFYAAYHEVAPLSPDYPDRRPLYQLHYLLVHLIHFGEQYGPAVDRVLQRYV
jgi:fructosamine-3-kinase